MSKPEMIKFRPHHFLCTLGFQGKGYSKGFVVNYATIVSQLNSDPDTFIEVTNVLDDICRACPHQTKHNLCSSQTKIEKLDLAHQKILGLFAGQLVSWNEAKKLIKDHMTVSEFHKACEGCEWKALGVCESALRDLVS